MNNKSAIRTSRLVVLGALAVIFAASGNAHAQDFMVKPMKMEFTARAGQTVESVLELRNAGGEDAKTLELKLVELTQGSDGGWQIIEPGSKVDTSKLPSCLNWITLSADTVTVEPLKMAPVTVSVKTPPNARGFYLAGLIAQIKPKPDEKGITVVVRFMIPVIVEIQGRPERQKIDLNDVGMEFREKTEKDPATTLVSMGIANQGRTYSRIKGSVSIMRYWWEGHWRLVGTTAIKELGIIPGVTLNLKSDLERRLPSGKYKLTGMLYVDGRRISPLEKEIDFAGDPTVTKLAVDTPLTLEPTILSVRAAPGANRTAAIKVENASDDAVNIEAVSSLPTTLKGVALGELKGEELCCAEWVKVSPEKFTLRGGGWRNIELTIKMPKSPEMHSNYYALLVLRARYPDGQSAGETTTLISVENKTIRAKPAAQVIKATLASEEPSKYIVQAKFGNVGNMHFTPKCTAVVTTAPGAMVVEAEMSGETSLMLPLETRDFSGVLDFSRVQAGTYFLKTAIEYAPRKVETAELPIQVSIDENQARLVEIIKVGEDKQDQKENASEPNKAG